jgi:hypothetical protein
MRSSSSAAASARSSSTNLLGGRWPTNRVSIGFGRLTSSSQWMLLGCFNPSPTTTMTCVWSSSYRVYTGAQTTEENRESIKICRLATTNTRCFRKSVGPGRLTRNRSPRSTYSGSPWNARTSDSPFNSSTMRSRITASFASRLDFAEAAKYHHAARSRNAERFESNSSIFSSNSPGRLTDVLILIPPSTTTHHTASDFYARTEDLSSAKCHPKLSERAKPNTSGWEQTSNFGRYFQTAR